MHFIVENTQKQLRSCMFAERDMSRDFVFVGQHARLPSSPTDLPLPLRTLTFAKDDRPTIRDVAHLLEIVSRKGEEYKLLTKNCWWYAGSMYKTLKASYKIEQATNWNVGMTHSWLKATLQKRSYTVSISASQVD